MILWSLLLLLMPLTAVADCVFAWDAPLLFPGGPVDPNAVAYRLYSSATPGGPYTLEATITAPTVQSNPVPCTQGSYWVVTAINADDPVAESANSNEVLVPPTATQTVVGRVVLQGRVTLR